MTCPRRRADALWRDLGEGESIVLVDRERAIVLNPTGTAVWHLADGSRDLDQIAAVLAEQHPGVGLEQIRADVARLLEQLLEQGLLSNPDHPDRPDRPDRPEQ